jgi:hypothetical protein
MSIHLEAAEGRSLKVNAWNWGVLHHRVAAARILPAEIWETMRFNAGDELDPGHVKVLIEFLERRVLSCLRVGERMFFDGSVTDQPDDGTFYRDEKERWKNYSLHRSVLIAIIEFLKAAGSPVRVS